MRRYDFDIRGNFKPNQYGAWVHIQEARQRIEEKDKLIVALCKIAKRGNPFCDPMEEAMNLIELEKEQALKQ